MGGRNLFESVHGKAFASTTMPSVCIFISHNSVDKPMARKVADALMRMGFDIYFDEKDVVLQTAVKKGKDQAIVACIEDGLDKCSHLLGLISKKTFDSWWVPYEIGGATGRKKKCAHMVAKDVTQLPSYVKVAQLIIDVFGLQSWLPSTTSPLGRLTEAIMKTAASGLDEYIPATRSEKEISFVP